ncbi:MAG: acyltransferase [Aestuariivirga sp.]
MNDLKALRELKKLIGIQILRGLAALMVVTQHVVMDFPPPNGGYLADAVSQFMKWGAGVDIFFVISGFIMVYSSRSLFAAPDGYKTFLRRRIARIVPLYWLATTAFLVLLLVMPSAINSGMPTLPHLVSSYLFWPISGADGTLQPVYKLGWTLNYEFFFYVLLALFMFLPLRKAVLAVSTTLIGIVALDSAMALPNPLLSWGQPLVLEFGAGMIIGLAKIERISLSRRWRVICFCAGLSLLYLNAAIPAPAFGFMALGLYGIPAFLLVISVSLSDEPHKLEVATPVSKSIGRVIAENLGAVGFLLGDASYSIYLLHPFILRGMHIVFGKFAILQAQDTASNIAFASYWFLSLVISSLIGIISYRWLEAPVTRFLVGFGESPQKLAAV